MRIEVDALKSLNEFLEAAPERTLQAASLAMNTIIPRSGLKRYKDAMKQQVAFPGGYLEDVEKFGVTQKASPTRLEAKITARARPTSLARFATGGTVGVEGLSVRVKAGRTVRLRRAFTVRLRAGTMLDGENFNLGLAVRVPGGAFRNKKDTSRMVHLAKDVFLLYGPSVDQVFRGVSTTETPAVLDQIETEFFRQFARLG
jgi:hypothetical protein